MMPAMGVKVTKPMPGDRAPLPHFAGRIEEMAKLDEQLDNLLLGNTTSGIQLITGVPGAGKSQLGRMFANAARERGDIRCVWVNVATVGRDVDLFLTIAEALDRDEEGRQVAELNAQLTGGAIGALGIRGQATLHRPRHTSAFPRLLAALQSAIEKKGMWGDGEALVLLIDELQTVRPPAMENLHTLHQGDHGCPIMVVGIGLQHMQAVLAHPADGSPGISRTSPPIILGSLSEDEAQEAIRENVAAIADETLSEDCVAKLAAASHGFPQHIHAYVSGAQTRRRRGGVGQRRESIHQARHGLRVQGPHVVDQAEPRLAAKAGALGHPGQRRRQRRLERPRQHDGLIEAAAPQLLRGLPSPPPIQAAAPGAVAVGCGDAGHPRRKRRSAWRREKVDFVPPRREPRDDGVRHHHVAHPSRRHHQNLAHWRAAARGGYTASSTATAVSHSGWALRRPRT